MSLAPAIRRRIETIYRDESRRVYATLVRLLGDMQLAEEALQDAFRAALEQWSRDGVPDNPRAWLVSAGRFKAIDRIRRDQRMQPMPDPDNVQADAGADPGIDDREGLDDDRLRLIFICCHPSIPSDARIALTLREVCGLTTGEVARAFLTPAATIAQRIVRAKTRIRDEQIPYQVPGRAQLGERLDAVLRVIYLVFNEGYSTTAGADPVRRDLSGEAIRLGRLLEELLPEPQVLGLLALMLLQESRRAARFDEAGDLVTLEHQNRALWDRELIDEGSALLRRALTSDQAGNYVLQAAIAATHADAPDTGHTRWGDIVQLYDLLLRIEPSPVIELNRAVAVAMHEGPEAGLVLIEELDRRGALDGYHLLYAVRADLCRRLGRVDDARTAYARALDLAKQQAEVRYLKRRLGELG